MTFDFLRNGLAYSLAIVALAWIIPGLGRSVEVRAVLAPINQRWEETTQRMNRLYQGINRQTRPVSSTFGRSLSLGGPRNVGNSRSSTSPPPRAATGAPWSMIPTPDANG